jgi:hypothetical protein
MKSILGALLLSFYLAIHNLCVATIGSMLPPFSL